MYHARRKFLRRTYPTIIATPVKSISCSIDEVNERFNDPWVSTEQGRVSFIGKAYESCGRNISKWLELTCEFIQHFEIRPFLVRSNNDNSCLTQHKYQLARLWQSVHSANHSIFRRYTDRKGIYSEQIRSVLATLRMR